MADRASTKKLIEQSFIELSNMKNVDKITIRDIVEHCGLTKTTFYNHFQDKYDLIVQIYAEPVKNIVNRFDANYGLREAIADVLNYSADNRRFIINVLKNTSGQNSFLYHVSKIHFTLLCDFVRVGAIDLRVADKKNAGAARRFCRVSLCGAAGGIEAVLLRRKNLMRVDGLANL